MTKTFSCSNDSTVVSTKAGKLRGFLQDSTYTFYGIKYADAKRWQMPEPVKPWEGIKDALGYGYVCPLLEQDKPGAGELRVPHRYWPMDENCQYLNIWTQTLNPNAKKAVMVWLHGGGFFAGSSIEQAAYDGENLSKYGDVVVVSLNHRLNVLGYLDLSPFGEKYKNSQNAGNADLVAALKWIHDNIAAFGGDPENVTLFGQSGGGMKVTSLMQTPEADGLFHKGIVMSGVMHNPPVPAEKNGKEIVTAMMKELGVDDVETLEKVPYGQLAKAYNKVSPAVAKAGGYVGNSPKANDWYLGEPLHVGLTEHAKTIPLMVGTVLGEFLAFAAEFPNRGKMTDGEIMEKVAPVYGGYAEEALALFREVYPTKDPIDLMILDTVMRPSSKKLIAMKAACPQAKTYSYQFTYTLPVDNGAGPWHCADIPFVFHNIDKVPVCNTPGITDRLEHQMFSAWVNFAKYGDPNDPSLPYWPACKPGEEACMIFDEVCEVRVNHDDALLTLAEAHGPQFSFEKTKIEH